MKLKLFFTKLAQFNKFMMLFTLLVFFILIKLGVWQSERATEKQQRLTRIEAYTAKTALPLADALSLEKENMSINDLPVRFSGEFISNVFLLDNQFDNNKLGYRVLQVIEDEQHAVLINLGWVAGSIDRGKLPKINAYVGQHHIQGHLRKVELGIQLQAQDFTNAVWPLRVQQIELDKFSKLLNKKLLPFVIYLDEEENLGYKKNWQPIVMPPEKHQAYAFQWFALAIAWLSLMIWAAMRNPKN